MMLNLCLTVYNVWRWPGEYRKMLFYESIFPIDQIGILDYVVLKDHFS